MQDVRGKEIVVGCKIAYPVRRGSDMELKIAQVSEVNEDCIYCFNQNGRRVRITQTKRTAVLGE